MAVLKRFAPMLLPLLFGIAIATSDYYDDSSEEEQPRETCDPADCQPPNCNCFMHRPNSTLRTEEYPMFVMLTFDDSITPVNQETYDTILSKSKRTNKGNNCNITATFFVTHQYNDYETTNKLYRSGNEIAVHSISHVSDTYLWRTANQTRWKNEMVGMRTILAEYSQIPESEIVGHRAPFLQTAGDTTMRMLSENKFLYDSSMPTRSYRDPPLWPYTLDNGYQQDCQIEPCPKGSYPGLWLVPMVQLSRADKSGFQFHCSMADACTPVPKTVEETKSYLKENFDRHYRTNRAPFPLFLHEAWLQDKARLQGYLNFIDEIRSYDDVFLVSVREVIEYMKNPVNVAEYAKQPCYSARRPQAGLCDKPVNCNYPKRNVYMKSCKACTKRYPWIANPMGQ